MQRQDFVELFEIMAGLPVTIRLLDPPLHEFLPKTQADMEQVAKALGVDLAEVEARAHKLHEFNPMLGHRGVRLGITYPEIYEMQARAIFEAVAEVQKKAGKTVIPEIMIPLIATKKELDLMKIVVDQVAGEVSHISGQKLEYMVGTMIELPRAALRAAEIAETAEFFSFGTNDLTQTTFGLSRDDSASFLETYQERGILEHDPFASLDVEGVGELIDIATGMRKFRRVVRDGRTIVSKSSYGLDVLVAHYFNELLEKKDTWRTSYGLLEDVPIHLWPTNARTYAVNDSIQHVRVYEAQDAYIAASFGVLPNQTEQQCAAFALHLMSTWGVRAEAKAVDYFVEHCEREIAKMKHDLEGTSIFKPNGSRTMAEIRRRVVESCMRRSVQVPMTDPSPRFPGGQVQTDKEALEETDDPALHVLAASMTFAKHLSQWAPVCQAAVQRPVCSRYEVLVETGRTSCGGSEGQEGSNMQNPPRKGDVRPCFVPRGPQYEVVEVSDDYVLQLGEEVVK
jgi:hypothetical protein